MDVRRAPRRPGFWARILLGLTLGVAAAGCRGKSGGELRPPDGARAWDNRLDQLFDDRFTPTAVELTGRAPGDVLDQRRFSQRLGYANLIVLVTVDQVWSRTLFGGQPQQRVEVTLGRVLRGKLAKKTGEGQVLVLRGADELPADAVGRVMLLFLAWAPGESPAYHHHLMPGDERAIALIEAMVRHARSAGQLDDGAREGRKRRRQDAQQ